MRQLSLRTIIHQPIDHVWSLIGTEAGIRSYMSPDIYVEPVVGGPYEIYFDMDQPMGLRGSEGMKVLSVEAPNRFAFTWNNPPSLPSIRGQQTAVFMTLEPVDGGTQVTLDHVGFGESEDWEKAYAYFTRAWQKIVLPRLVDVAENGPRSWQDQVDMTDFVDRVHVMD